MIICLSIVSVNVLHAQNEDTIRWVKQVELAKGNQEAWTIDVFGNMYLTNKRVIQKFDSSGVLKFTQSIKSFGKVSQILPINAMKLMLFSEEQQILCLMDNTLTLSEECIDLSLYNIGFASHIAVSGQPDKIWVVDQLNSRILLLDLGRKGQFQEIKNLKGILNMGEVVTVHEYANELYLADSNGKVFRFDVYGTLLSIDQNPGTIVDFVVKDGVIIAYDGSEMFIRSSEDQHIQMPESGIKDFEVEGEFFYFEVENKILKYSLKIGL